MANLYDVFVNHRGPDTKKGVVSHIYAALKRANYTAFVDDMELAAGANMWPTIKYAIANSKVQIAVFSPAYAESRWCLDELQLMLECCQRPDRPAYFLPVFYNVQPSELRLYQSSSPLPASRYSAAIQMLSCRYASQVIDDWIQALKAASSFSGFVFPEDFNRDEALLVEKVLGYVIDRLSEQALLPGPDHPVGLDERLQHALDIMGREELKEIRVKKLGICGMGGLGKTTLAKSIYNRMHREFESACYLPDISNAATSKGFEALQVDMLKQLLRGTSSEISVPDSERGRQMIRHRFAGKKVLIILDNVSEKEHLDQLMPPHDCPLGKDSQIVITTRDQKVLTLAHVDSHIWMDGLSKQQARELFNKHAFPEPAAGSGYQEFPPKAFKRLAEKIADACQGLPLALEVIGSHLRDNDIDEWQATSNALAKRSRPINPQRKVISTLKISYNALRSQDEQEMFLDIACFLKGEQKDKALRMWRSLYNDEIALLNLRVLISKCLVKISKNGDLIMHDLLCAMGWDIAETEKKDFWDRAHLWQEEYVCRVLRERIGTNHVRALGSSVEKTWETESFTVMRELKLLMLSNITLTGDFSKMPKELRWFQLRHSPFATPLLFSRSGFDNIAVLDLEGSLFSSFDIDDCMLKTLKELNLKNCTNLQDLPSRFGEKSNNLEKLILSGCVKLQGFPEWIGKQSVNLRYLDISFCRNITDLPDDLTSLRALTCLLMNGCCGLTRLPSTVGKLIALEFIGLDRVPLDELPESFFSLTLLKSLRLDHSMTLRELPSTVHRFKWMTSLDISSCPLIPELPRGVTSLGSLRYLRVADCEQVWQLPADIYGLWNLEELHLNDLVNLSSLPSSLDSLSRLEYLSLKGCSKLAKVEHLPCELTSFDVSGCTSMRHLNMSGCRKLKTLPVGIECMKSLTVLLMHECDSLTGFADAMPQLPTLEEIGFDKVPLKTYPKSFEGFSNLTSLRFYSLKDLPGLPSTVGNLIKLTSLEIISCDCISKIPETLSNLQNLVCFRVIDCPSVFKLPTIIGELRHLEEFHVSFPLCVHGWEEYVLRGCTIWDLGLPKKGYATFSALKKIVLRGVSIPSLPEDFERLPNLEELILKECIDLKKVLCLPTSLQSLNLRVCSGLEGTLALGSLTRLSHLELWYCGELVKLDGLESLPLLSYLDVTKCNRLKALAGIEKCTLLKSLFIAGSGVSLLQDARRPWIQTSVSRELQVSLHGNVVPSYFLSGFPGESRECDPTDIFTTYGRRDAESLCWRIDVPNRGDAICKGLLCCFVAREKFHIGQWGNLDRPVITWASTCVKVEVEGYSQALFYNRVADGNDELHICIFRESHPLVASLKGGCTLSLVATGVYDKWEIDVHTAYVQFMYEENEMEEALQQLTLMQSRPH